MTKFSLNGLGTPVNSAQYDNEEAYKELLFRVNNKERLSIGCLPKKDNYPTFWVSTARVSRFQVRVNQDIWLLVIKYLINAEINDLGINSSEVEPYEKEQDFNLELAQLLIEAKFEPQVVPLFRTKYGYVEMYFHFPNGSMFFRLERTEELMNYLAAQKLI